MLAAHGRPTLGRLHHRRAAGPALTGMTLAGSSAGSRWSATAPSPRDTTNATVAVAATAATLTQSYHHRREYQALQKAHKGSHARTPCPVPTLPALFTRVLRTSCTTAPATAPSSASPPSALLPPLPSTIHFLSRTSSTTMASNDAGVRITRIGLYANLCMAIAKGLGGYVFNSQAMVADAIHSVTDLASDILTLATISWSLKPPTDKFPYGFGKIESLGSLGVSGMLLFGGMWMGYGSLITIYGHFFLDPAAAAELASHAHGHSHGHDHGSAIPSLHAAWLAASTVGIKEWLYRATMKVATERKSSVLASNAVHHRVDSLTGIVTLAVIVGANVITNAAWLDPVGGLVISSLVVRAGWANTLEGLAELADRGIDDEVKASVQKQAQTAMAEVSQGHEAELREVFGLKSGQNYLVDLEVAVPGTWTVDDLQRIEDAIRIKVGGKVRGVRKVRVRFVSKERPVASKFDEFIAGDVTIVVSSDLTVVAEAKVDFDADFGSKYGIKKGVRINEQEGEVYQPVAMWVEAVDLVITRLRGKSCPMDRIKGVSGSGQQHSSVYWSDQAEKVLKSLDPELSLLEQLGGQALAYEFAPNWQDHSTQKECDDFDAHLGAPQKLAGVSGSAAHHRFTGTQILRMRRRRPQVYDATARISLCSSFLASVFLGSIAPFDISDVTGMNLWDISSETWNQELLELTAGSAEAVPALRSKLGDVPLDGGVILGAVSPYFVERFGFSKDCHITAFTGDNPATILSLPLRPLDAIVSLGTSSTFLMSTPHYKPDPSYHFMNHPTTKGHYMFMLCYKNGGLAREKVRDALPKPQEEAGKDPWANFNKAVLETPPLDLHNDSDPAKLGLYFPLPEIVPNVRAGMWRYTCDARDGSALAESKINWPSEADARIIVESQALSMRLRSQNLVSVIPGRPELPPQPRRIYLVGGGSLNPAIARAFGDVLGGAEGVYRLDVGGNACALGGAYKALWACERGEGESFDELIGARWKEEGNVQKVDDGYREREYKVYGSGVIENLYLNLSSVFKLPYNFIRERYFTKLEDRCPFVQQASPFEDFVIRCVRFAFANIPPRVGRVFFSKQVALPFLRFRMLCHGYVRSPVHWREYADKNFRGIWAIHDPTKQPDVCVYYAHGGGFSMGSSYFYLEFLLSWLELLKKAGYANPSIFALEYTLVPDASFPKQLEEAIAGYEHVLSTVGDPAKVCVSGDSAGATIMVSLLLHLANMNRHADTLDGTGKWRLAKPALAVMISPWVTLVSDRHSNTKSDYLDARRLHIYAEDYAGKNVPSDDCLLSPGRCKDISWWQRACPSGGIFVEYGDEEVFAADIRELARFLKENGVRITSRGQFGGIHAWPVASLFLSQSDKRLNGLKRVVQEIKDNI
ncbi:cation efflux family-domain-containing protein [Astrocystis sublimbata]|nr:cation efflux family-domain-containing protein [Astrocystis sublimbata]